MYSNQFTQSRQQPPQQAQPKLKKGDEITFCIIARNAQYDNPEDNPERIDFQYIQILAINGIDLPQPWNLTAGIANKPADLKLQYESQTTYIAQIATPSGTKTEKKKDTSIISIIPPMIDGGSVTTNNPTRDDSSLTRSPEFATAAP